jgi:hypothetical protein
MAITEVPEYAHLSDADIEALAAALEEIRCDIEASRGTKDRAYIKRTIAFQRCLEIAARLAIARSKGRFGLAAGTAAQAAAKCIENMELGHNISHGQWDWMTSRRSALATAWHAVSDPPDGTYDAVAAEPASIRQRTMCSTRIGTKAWIGASTNRRAVSSHHRVISAARWGSPRPS